MGTRSWLSRSIVALLASATLIAGCGGSGGDGAGGYPAADSPTPTATEPAGPASRWSAQADEVCRQTYENRGRPPQAQSGKLDDDMALAENWRANLAFVAARDLAELSGPPAGAQDLVTAFLDYQKASVQVAEIYLEGGYQPVKLQAAETARDEARTSVEGMSVKLETPSCTRVVNTTE